MTFDGIFYAVGPHCIDENGTITTEFLIKISSTIFLRNFEEPFVGRSESVPIYFGKVTDEQRRKAELIAKENHFLNEMLEEPL